MEFFTVMGKVWTEYSSLFLHGLWMTLYMGALTVLISTVSGSLMAMMHRSSWGIGRFKPLHAAAVVYVEVIRGTPILLQLYFFYFMLPQWFPALDLSEFTCVMIACCVNSTAYVCEIVRARDPGCGRGTDRGGPVLRLKQPSGHDPYRTASGSKKYPSRSLQ